MKRSAMRTSAIVLCGLAAFQAATIALFHRLFLPPVFAHWERLTWLGWLVALTVAALYIGYSVRGLAPIRRYFWTVSAFKITGLAIAIPAAILEEVFFRQSVMNALLDRSTVIQIAASAVSFGLAHAVWGIRGGWRALIGAVGSTTLMGAALAVTFIASNRVILPCIVSHFIITFALEPWLLYAYIDRATSGPRATGAVA